MTVKRNNSIKGARWIRTLNEECKLILETDAVCKFIWAAVIALKSFAIVTFTKSGVLEMKLMPMAL